MIKIFREGDRGGDTFKTPSPYEQLLPLPTPCFKIFLERSLNDPLPPTIPLQASFTATPLPIHHPFPPKNFDHTPGSSLHYFAHIVKVKFVLLHLLTVLTKHACQHNSFWGNRCVSSHVPTISLKPALFTAISAHIFRHYTSLLRAHFMTT